MATVFSISAAGFADTKEATVLFVIDPDTDVQPLMDQACGAFGLTATERKLVGYILGGKTITIATKHMRIQVPTARTYLKQIFSKTGTHRQADLVRVILSSIVPFS